MKPPALIHAYVGKPVGPSDWELGLWMQTSAGPVLLSGKPCTRPGVFVRVG
jgi:hypothetical protein